MVYVPHDFKIQCNNYLRLIVSVNFTVVNNINLIAFPLFLIIPAPAHNGVVSFVTSTSFIGLVILPPICGRNGLRI